MVAGGAGMVVVSGGTLVVDDGSAEVVVLGGRADVVVTTLVETSLALAEVAEFATLVPHALRSPPIDSRPTDPQLKIRLMNPPLSSLPYRQDIGLFNVNSNSFVCNTKHHPVRGNDTLLIYSRRDNL